MRSRAAAVRRWLRGARPAPEYVLTRWVFLRLLGVVYLVAFASLAVQIVGLVGENGILPAADFLERAREGMGPEAYRRLPTLCWLDAGDATLRLLCWTGVAAALLLVAGIATTPALVLLWALYLSLAVAGQTFLLFQWDALLLETGLIAIFWAPLSFGREPRTRPSTALRGLLWLLVFKLMFLSGVTKLASGDPTWADWTALEYHYWTQPLPAWTSWWAHQLPAAVQRASVGLMFLAEIVAPFGILAPPRWRELRWLACGGLLVLQLGIAATGSYGFFNLLSAVLCLTLLDDAVWRRLLPARLAAAPSPAPRRRAAMLVAGLVTALLAPLSLLTLDREVARTLRGGALGRPGPADAALARVAPLRSLNGYGLFRVMTTERPEIVIEGSADGATWRPYEFAWKPGDRTRRPRFSHPHMPRLDWQMWFAALGPGRQQHWLLPLSRHLLEGTPEVLDLLGHDPFPGDPPRLLRLRTYRYRFAPPGADAWWEREATGVLAGPFSLEDLER